MSKREYRNSDAEKAELEPLGGGKLEKENSKTNGLQLGKLIYLFDNINRKKCTKFNQSSVLPVLWKCISIDFNLI